MPRGSSPGVAVVLLALVTVLAAAAVGAAIGEPPDPTPVADLRLSVDASADRLTIRHAAGDALDVADLEVRVSVAGEPLAHQPPVPFFAARGFASGPTGPFNPAGGTTWRAGQTATLGLAGTNAPLPDEGDRVTVTVSTDTAALAELEATAI